MKAVEVDLSPVSLAGLLEEATEDDLLIHLADGREFLVVAVDDFDHEIARTRTNEKLMNLLDERVKSSERISLGEVKQRLGL